MALNFRRQGRFTSACFILLLMCIVGVRRALHAQPGCMSMHAQFRAPGTPFFGTTHALTYVSCNCDCKRYGVEDRQLRCKNCGHSHTH